MSERLLNALMITLIVLASALLAFTVSTQPASENRVDALGARIKCPVCQGESIADSPAQMATDMMTLVADRVAQGQSDEAIIAEVLSSYSGAVLLDPPLTGPTLFLWIAPVAAAVVGLGVIAWWRRHPGAREETVTGDAKRSRSRLIVGGLALAGAFVVIVIVAAFAIKDSTGAAEGAAALGPGDLANVSNETMEAVIAANLDNPQIDGMRLALADRYYEAGDYRSAFPHYLAVAQSAGASSSEVVAALVRLGWMAYDGNDEITTALDLIDQALAIDSTSQVARYVKARLLWCGNDDAVSASVLLQGLLDDPDLAEESRPQIEADLNRAAANEECR